MSNITLKQIEDGLAATINGVASGGIVVTDTRLSQGDAELVSLLTSQSEDEGVNGWTVALSEIPQQEDDGPCEVIVTYRFKLVYLFGYFNDELEAEISAAIFKRNIFNVNEGLNRKRDLGLGNQVRHNCLQSSEPFDLLDYTDNNANKLSHIAIFDLDVEVINSY